MEAYNSVTFLISKDYCHTTVVDLFSKLIQNPSFKLFTITTDVDNLGIFVAKYGRAAGQNYVDLSTNIISSFINPSNIRKLGIDEIALLPGGEEITIIGISFSEVSINNFVAELKQFVNKEISSYNKYQYSCPITFGYKIIEEKKLLKDIKAFIEKLKSTPDTPIFSEYYTILYNIRTIVSPEVDRIKFHNLGVSGLNELIFFRNLVYSEVVLYKNRTKSLLSKIAKKLYKLDGQISKYNNYGLGEYELKQIEEVKEFLLNNDDANVSF